eukprot:CAMPEP_0117424640 /NCGR_PEP_ID=MMETSP0758-20121206/5021_1 /TAXON_ID=63605 /ORGANISM="Percolomonas cosmopolitus, Strain AE-1 (ATCC 50343)" /LENGTH=350 /DNA_ID=CAMNT_0005208545 /DNA_START=741 /DNA_END=1789 /DNA_ORIENTATION=-
MKIEDLQDKIESLKYTIDMLRAKLSKLSDREIENQQRLKLFEQYQPIFEDLREHFHFDTPAEVVNRMIMLEKKQTDSYHQLSDAEKQNKELKREMNHLKRIHEADMRERMKDIQAKLETVQMERDNFEAAEVNHRNKIREYKDYKEKYLQLHSAVIDVYTTWMKDIKGMGKRYEDEIVDPDFSHADQVLAGITNLLISFQPSKAGQIYIQFSQIANSYWLEHYSNQPSIKGRPKVIFETLGNTLKSQNKELDRLKIENKRLLHELSKRKEGQEKLEREKRVLENSILVKRDALVEGKTTTRPSTAKTKRPGSAAPIMSSTRPSSAVRRLKSAKKRSTKRPGSAITRPRSA